ncbi:hypothetical protein wVul_0089 [Wolbachia endosymbiont of Armadillidium vulgare str. wVulC]|uniref:hypothetical protein n=1 Tax=Wolbachia endosymbiont of Armadillidium vulgare TaxID=77039 RepID=UPI00064B677B|nr:hypothetical protein [Wolbachia endosymbiont of Armadillidium vulgare]KLT22886.1 hypothetical protein wVul_0089 [Wolbachia endosymbiont of Armadillidium vulgare str. wVulC]OJH31640.1 hypothetical protein Wxf_01034 [Wolbachia endosymbiont of Armadillidium vulgare]OJH32049.1 hypothetical protein Wxf_01468 [Wolbachia endosymbiont of Armadillidium vulgare]OJH32606.1 hypothetical protein Wxf_02048 [Wolbachia endosymbiont of Armadillidium vulgare]OJH33228.1 hypothetical protein Wxf_02702 [Wolbach
MFSWLFTNKSEENNNFLPKGKENVVTPPPKTNSQIDPAMQSVLRDFEKLDYNDNKCFNKIAEKYKKERGLFDYVVLNKYNKIVNILDNKLPDLKKQEEFRKRLGEYIHSRIREGMSYGEKLQDKLEFFKDNVEEVLSDFEKLRFNFESNKCEDSNDSVNYNGGRPADPFDKIANYYRRKKDIFLFNYAILSKQKEIMNILDKKFTNEDQKKNFENRLGRYLLRMNEGMNDAKELLGEDNLIGFFDGCYWPDEKAGRFVNHYNNLSINIIKPGQSLETSRLFTDKIERMEKNKNEVERVKIHSNGKRIVTIEKNEKQQRNYCFEEDAICNLEIRWGAKNEKVNCFISLNVNSGKIEIGKATINDKDVELDEILKLAEQNEDVLIEGKALHEFLAEYLKQDVQSQEEIIKRCDETPGSKLDNVKIGRFSFSPLSEEEIDEEEIRKFRIARLYD